MPYDKRIDVLESQNADSQEWQNRIIATTGLDPDELTNECKKAMLATLIIYMTDHAPEIKARMLWLADNIAKGKTQQASGEWTHIGHVLLFRESIMEDGSVRKHWDYIDFYWDGTEIESESRDHYGWDDQYEHDGLTPACIASAAKHQKDLWHGEAFTLRQYYYQDIREGNLGDIEWDQDIEDEAILEAIDKFDEFPEFK